MNDSQQKGKIFTGMVFINCPKDGKKAKQVMKYTLNKALFIVLPNLKVFFLIHIS
jgi:hypothetical protein